MNASQIHIKRISSQMKLAEEGKVAEKRKMLVSRFSAKSPLGSSNVNKKVSLIGLKAPGSGIKHNSSTVIQ